MKTGKLAALFAANIITILPFAGARAQLRPAGNQIQVRPREVAASGFITPADSIQTSVYWYWISDNISKEGVIKDLHAMKRAGINRAFIGNIGLDETAYGPVKMFTDEWWDIIHAALKTATELHIDIGIFNSPGWSQSGGPWIKPQQAMRYLTSSETDVTGGNRLSIRLAQPVDSFQDVRVMAFPAPKDYRMELSALHPNITSIPAVENVSQLMDGNLLTEARFPAADELMVQLSVPTDFSAQSIVVYPAHRQMKLEGEILAASPDGSFHKIRDFVVDRSNSALNTGFDPYGPVAISIPPTVSTTFRLLFKHTTPQDGIAELQIRKGPTVENYIEKTLGKMHPVPLPYWKEYQWPVQPAAANKDEVVDPASVVDISPFMKPDGQLDWNAPAGEWVILRTGMTPTRVTNSPSPPEGRGLEVDKMSAAHVAEHFNAFLGEIQKHIPAADRQSWKMVVEDSYETGGQNWTDSMTSKFKAAFGYDPLPFLPVFNGIVVGSQDQSDRFLWDLRRFIADKVAYEYVAGLRDVSHLHGLRTWLECYGHWGFPGEFLQYGGQSDEVAGEFWSEGELGNIENRAASSCAHIYGKTKVSAESFTAGGNGYARYPAMFKQRGDRFFTEGINNTLLHVYIEQPDERVPGVNAPFGNEFNRHNTWFNQLDLFTSYVKRCNYMLQQGRYVADAAYFIGEDAPKMTGVRDPEIPQGYAYDYINAEVIENRMTIRNGRWTLPDGLSYSLLVLPKLKTMRPALLRKIMQLVDQGGVLLGPAPERSPSLQDYVRADEEVKEMAQTLWMTPDNALHTIDHKYGKGRVLDGFTMQQALDRVPALPDCRFDSSIPALYIHRQLPDEDIYFISNQSDKPITLSPYFRVQGKKPFLWDAVTGAIRALHAYRQISGNQSAPASAQGMTMVPLSLDGYQSVFIVFRTSAEGTAASMASDGNLSEDTERTLNFPAPAREQMINTPWMVRFDKTMRGPAQPVKFNVLTDWTQRPEDSIRNYSGTAIYRNTFFFENAPHTDAPGRVHVFLDAGMVRSIAKIKVNGIYVGGVWTPPYRVDITKAVRQGNNNVEVEVANTWVNRLIGDSKLPVNERKTWTNVNIYGPDSPYEPSGLLGPVKVQVVQFK